MRSDDGLSLSEPTDMTRVASVGWLGPSVVVVALLGTWETVVRCVGVPEYLVPAPSRIASAFWEKRVSLVGDLWVTLLESVLGFVLANSLSLVMAVGFFYSRTAERAVFPILIGLKCVPLIAMAPLLVLWIGYGLGSKIAMAAVVAFFPAVVGATTGLRAATAEAVDLMRSLSATRWEILTKVCFPTAVPHIVAALKVSSTLAVIGAVVGEMTGARRGLGFAVLMATYNFDTPSLFAALVLSAFAGLVLFLAIVLLERGLWRYYLGRADL